MTGARGRLIPVLAATILWAVLALAPVRAVLESSMLSHMTVQIPLLAAVGVGLGAAACGHEPGWLAASDRFGIPSILVASFGAMFWMVPRSLDAAIAGAPMEVGKFLSVPLLIGLPLALGWRRMPALGRAFVWANGLAMLAGIGGIYLIAPVRLCAFYRLDQQDVTGRGLIAVAAALGAYWVVVAFRGPTIPREGR